MCKTDKEAYEKYWDDISPFIKFGCLKDEKFCDKINDYILFKDINDKYQTLPELLAPVAEDEKSDAESADASDRRAEVSRALSQAGCTVLALAAENRTLEEVFLALTENESETPSDEGEEKTE